MILQTVMMVMILLNSCDNYYHGNIIIKHRKIDFEPEETCKPNYITCIYFSVAFVPSNVQENAFLLAIFLVPNDQK